MRRRGVLSAPTGIHLPRATPGISRALMAAFIGAGSHRNSSRERRFREESEPSSSLCANRIIAVKGGFRPARRKKPIGHAHLGHMMSKASGGGCHHFDDTFRAQHGTITGAGRTCVRASRFGTPMHFGTPGQPRSVGATNGTSLSVTRWADYG